MELNEKGYCHDQADNLEQEILDLINDTTESNYIGGLKVTHEDGIYTLFLYLDVQFAPIQLVYEGSEDDFKNYIRNELKSRRLESVPRGRLVQQVVINHE